MEIRLIKDWKRKRGTVKKGTTLIVTNDVARDLIKKKIAKEVRDGFIKLFKASRAEPETESKQGYQKVNKGKLKKKEE